MARRRVRLLTTDNATGNGTPAVADLVAVQNNIIDWLSDFRTEMRQMLRDGREDHRKEHEELRAEIKDWQTVQARTCSTLMAPYREVGQAVVIVRWLASHPKITTGGMAAVLALSAIIGGLVLPGR